ACRAGDVGGREVAGLLDVGGLACECGCHVVPSWFQTLYRQTPEKHSINARKTPAAASASPLLARRGSLMGISAKWSPSAAWTSLEESDVRELVRKLGSHHP